jgi:hypothetical protein
LAPYHRKDLKNGKILKKQISTKLNEVFRWCSEKRKRWGKRIFTNSSLDKACNAKNIFGLLFSIEKGAKNLKAPIEGTRKAVMGQIIFFPNEYFYRKILFLKKW